MSSPILLRILNSALLVCGIVCFGSQDKILDMQCNVNAPERNFSTLQTFFISEDGKYIISARFIASGKVEKTINDFTNQCKFTSPSILKSIPNVFKYSGKGLYEGYQGDNSLCWMFKTYTGEKPSPAVLEKILIADSLGEKTIDWEESDEQKRLEKYCNDYDRHENSVLYRERCERRRNPFPIIVPVGEEFYVKKIHHTGVTERLLDMPECSVALGSDYVQLHLPYLNSPAMLFADHHTIVDPKYVTMIRESLKSGKIFVLNVKNETDKQKSYKVLGYKNSAYIHWDGWSPIQFFWKYIGNDSELSGFEDASKVQPEKEIEIDPWNQDGTRYRRNQRIAWFMKVLSIGSGSLAICYLLWQDKIADIIGTISDVIKTSNQR